ncbi:hypothetical protein QR680_014927 [Steinernema hermaphroditum]|uniref:legumain n=1 Tax=Steinernema hermaphroditum TaxID=289476 RepID=A0AA39M417_9BILA|nr:hypothetical protein QR680_014925 [Steinernema hermaphroditum]KAK0420856.1 hypothetical protein QR680_014927 [Steinernema hermaphroditum]
MHRLLHLLVLAFMAISATRSAPVDGAPKKWALLIAGSNGWYNYRHQADVCHAYQILRKHGVPADNIVTMMFDDIAYAEGNPFPGQIFNSPKRVDVYSGVQIDYKGDDVNAEVFLSVLKGNKSAVEGRGNGRVIESGPNDHVFVYYADHGATGIVGMPAGDPLTKEDLWDALHCMHTRKTYSKLVFYLEACVSGSMFDDFPTDRNVYAMTASNPDESSWGCYCDEGDLPCLGDEFSVNWMHDSEQNQANKETLRTQFSDTKVATTKSHVSKYGDFDFLTEAVGDFQGDRCDGSEDPEFVEPKSSWAVQDIPLRELEKKIRLAKTEEARETFQKELRDTKEKRERVANLYRSIASRVLGSDPLLLSEVVSVRPLKISQKKCHSQVVKFFDKHCLSFSQNPFAFHHAFILANLCELQPRPASIFEAIAAECKYVNVQNVM